MYEQILVVGIGFLGRYIFRDFTDLGTNVIGTRLSSNDNIISLDICNLESIEKCISKTNPDLIINCAANVNLDFIEKNPDIGRSVNADGPKNLAKVALKNKIRLVHISTDGVFDGNGSLYKEEDIPNPINEYGKTKLLGERNIQKILDDYVIIRTNFYGINERKMSLLNWIIQKLSQKEEIIGFNDIIFNPLEVSNLSKLVIDVVQSDFKGILHLASNDVISKYEFAMKVANIFNFDENLITKGTSNDVKLIASRPKNTSLSNKKAQKILTTKIDSLNESLITVKKNFKNKS